MLILESGNIFVLKILRNNDPQGYAKFTDIIKSSFTGADTLSFKINDDPARVQLDRLRINPPLLAG